MNKSFTCLFVAFAGVCLPLMSQQQTQSKPYRASKAAVVNLGQTAEEAPLRELREMPAQAAGKQDAPGKRAYVFKRGAVVNLAAIKQDLSPTLMIREMPKQGASKMIRYPESRSAESSGSGSGAATLNKPVKGLSFIGNPFSVSTPNDNDIAISDSGIVLSVMNTNLLVRNTNTGASFNKSLFAFTQPLNNLQHEFDPKVVYDPVADRFIVACMVGFVDSTSKIIIGFSQTADPSGSWNLYELPGDALKNNLWSDYPMIALSEKELFLSVNLLYNDSSWQTGFVETIIWQMSKDSGYVGGDLSSVLHSNIKWQGKSIRNLCPVKGGSRLYGPDMYFLSNRNLASSNDTVFLVHLSDVIGSPTSSISVKALRCNKPYYFPPDGIQKGTSELLATNDSRNLGAFFENNKIQYVHNTKHPLNNRPTIMYGVIHNPGSANAAISSFYIENGGADFGYPNLSYAGLNSSDHTSIITFNHSSATDFPGCSAVRADGWGLFSPVLKIQDGLNYVSLLQSDLERWGDYSGSQRRYNKPGEVWMSGYHAYSFNAQFPKAHAAWIAQLTTDEGLELDLKEQGNNLSEMGVFPNPASDIFSIDLELGNAEYLSIELYSAGGALVAVLLRDWVKGHKNIFSFNTRDLSAGMYLLKVSGNNGTNISKKVLIK